MGWFLIGLYILASAALVLALYNYMSIQELLKANKFNSQYIRRVEGKVSNIEKITDSKKRTWK